MGQRPIRARDTERRMQMCSFLDVVNVRVAAELDAVVVAVLAKGVGLVDLSRVRQLAVRLQVPGLT